MISVVINIVEKTLTTTVNIEARPVLKSPKLALSLARPYT
jgi:hypothetical protein